MKELLPLLLVSLAAVLSACGGGGSDEQPLGGASASSSSVATVDIDPSGLGPDASGRYADARGFYPDAAGRYPDADGVYPNSSGSYLTTAEAGIFENEHGKSRSYSTLGLIDTNPATNPFFKPFGSNQRSCATCHDPADGFTVTPKRLQERFNATNGTDPIFRIVDGSNSPTAPVSTLVDRLNAYSMLLSRGVIRVSLPTPSFLSLPGPVNSVPAHFVIDSASDPYGHGTTSVPSVFRRVLPSTNLKFLGSVMWDERETLRIPRDLTPGAVNRCQNPTNLNVNSAVCVEFPFTNNLKRQANGATTGHGEFATGLTPAEQQAIVDFEMSLFTAQEFDNSAKFLAAAKAKGGSTFLSNVNYYFDINGATDPAGTDKTKTMQMFGAWTTPPSKGGSDVAAARASIARGEAIFNTKTFTMLNVAGAASTTVTGATCTNCHKTPQIGSLSVPVAFDIGISDPAWNPQAGMPLYTLRNTQIGNANTGKTIQTYDPGQALITGRWGDVNKFKVPSMRGLATRAPYFHDGSAKTIEDTTTFYIKRFNMVMTAQETADLNAFLKSL